MIRFVLGLIFFLEVLKAGNVDVSLHTVENPLLENVPEKVVRKSRCFKDFKDVLFETAETIVTLHTNLISWDTFRLAVAAVPFFIASRMTDNKLHHCFYQKKKHKNTDQLPQFFFNMAEYGIGIPIVLLGSYALYGQTAETRKMGRTFLTAMPFVIFGKDIIKMLKFDFCKRPWNEHFNNKHQAHGGFPSGHMAQAVYMASFFGTKYGPSHAIPLGIFAGLVGVTFINCNRHYLSQIVAGSVWGGMFALSSLKIMEKYTLAKNNIEMGMSVTDQGAPAMSLTYNF